jgi:hypothetical protein
VMKVNYKFTNFNKSSSLAFVFLGVHLILQSLKSCLLGITLSHPESDLH